MSLHVMATNLSTYTNTAYNPGSTLKRTLWYFTNLLLFKTMLPFPSAWKAAVLRMFGAQVGAGVVIKPNVNIKYPWYLHVGDHVWIGAKATVCPGVTCKHHSVLAVSSVIASEAKQSNPLTCKSRSAA